MVHFPGFAPPSYGFRRRCSEFTRNGFPHSEISGSQAACASPKLIAACHVLHRLLAPRHPPYALSSLTIKLTREQYPPLEVQAPGESNALFPASLFTLRIQLSKIGSRSRPTAPRATLRRSMPPTLSERPASNPAINHYTRCPCQAQLPAGTVLALGDKSSSEVLNRDGFPPPCRFYRLLNCKLGLLGEPHCAELVILTNNRSLSLDSS